MQRELKAAILISLLLALCSGSVLYAADAAEQESELKWTPLIPKPIAEGILHNQALSDEQKVTALTYELDKCITLAPLTPPDILNTTDYEKKKMQPGRQYAWLIDMMVERDWEHQGGAKARPEAVAASLSNLNTLPEIKNKQTVRSLLYVALALAGGDVPESELLRLLKSPDTPPEILYRTLSAMLGSKRDHSGKDNLPRLVEVFDCPSKVSLRSLPILLKLANHPWNYHFYRNPGVDSLVRVYPVRERAYECLLELGLKAERVLIPDSEASEEGHPNLPITEIKVDRASAAKALQRLK